MSDDLDRRSNDDRLEELKAEFSGQFGKFTRWKAMCQERDVTNVEEKIRLAEEVLASPSTGTNAEWLTHHLRLQGGKSFDVDEMLAGVDPGSREGRGVSGEIGVWAEIQGMARPTRRLPWRATTRATSSSGS